MQFYWEKKRRRGRYICTKKWKKLEEKIKRDPNRLDIGKLQPQDTVGSQLTGGYIFQVDRAGNPGYDSWASNYHPCDSTNSVISFAYSYPNASTINTPQKNYIANYVDSFEFALKFRNLYDSVNGYKKYIDPLSFIDFSILQELGKNVDGYRLSSYCYKKKDGKMFAGPIWDFNEAYGNSDYYGGRLTYGFEWDFPCPAADGYLNPFWWKKLITDTSYWDQLVCHYTQLRTTALDTTHIFGVIDSLVNILQVPQTRHFLRWPILGVYIWPNAYVAPTYSAEIDSMKSWLRYRIDWLDDQWFAPGCLDTAVITPTSTAMLNKLNEVSVYPNPARDELHVTTHLNINRITVHNIMGQKMYEQDAGGSRTFTMPLKQYGINSGVFSITVFTQRGILRKTFVVDN